MFGGYNFLVVVHDGEEVRMENVFRAPKAWVGAFDIYALLVCGPQFGIPTRPNVAKQSEPPKQVKSYSGCHISIGANKPS